MKTEQQTFFNYTVVGKDGSQNSVEYKSEKQFEEAKAEAAKIESTITVVKQQTFELTTAETIDELLTVVPNEQVALEYFNYGLTLAQHNVKRDLMRDPEWPGVEGVYALINDVQQPKEKRVADPKSAARKTLRALFEKLNPGAPVPTDDEINSVLAQFAGAAVTA